MVRLMGNRCESTGNGAKRRLRREGKLPVVLHGYGREEVLSVDAKQLRDILRSEAAENVLIDLFINGDPPERCHVMLHAANSDPVSPTPLQVDFYRLPGDEPADVTRHSIPERSTAAKQQETPRAQSK